jgi:hypothetical protein
VAVRLHLAHPGELRVDGRSAGAVAGDLVLELAPGPHRLELVHAGGVETEDVLVVTGTTPTFDLGG